MCDFMHRMKCIHFILMDYDHSFHIMQVSLSFMLEILPFMQEIPPWLQLDVCLIHHFDNAANVFWGSKGSGALSCWTNPLSMWFIIWQEFICARRQILLRWSWLTGCLCQGIYRKSSGPILLTMPKFRWIWRVQFIIAFIYESVVNQCPYQCTEPYICRLISLFIVKKSWNTNHGSHGSTNHKNHFPV